MNCESSVWTSLIAHHLPQPANASGAELVDVGDAESELLGDLLLREAAHLAAQHVAHLLVVESSDRGVERLSRIAGIPRM